MDRIIREETDWAWLCLPPASAGFFAWLLFNHEDVRGMFLRNGFLRTTRRYNPEYRTLHRHRCENLKPNKIGSYYWNNARCIQCKSTIALRQKSQQTTPPMPWRCYFFISWSALLISRHEYPQACQISKVVHLPVYVWFKVEAKTRNESISNMYLE
jgi:hypothetical protein